MCDNVIAQVTLKDKVTPTYTDVRNFMMLINTQ